MLEESHRPLIFLPGQERLPGFVTADIRAIDSDIAIAVHFAWLDHGGEENVVADSASVDRGTTDSSELRQIALAIETIDVVRLERCVGRKVDRVLGEDGRNGSRLLVALQHDIDAAEVATGAEDAAFITVVAGKDPEAIIPGIVNDVVNVSNGGLGECVGNLPSLALIRGSVDVDFVAGGVVEILS